ncbi:MAG: DUF2141 domain-containing protein [Sphingomonadales bacterium]
MVPLHDEKGNYDLDMKDGYPLEGYGVTGAKDAYDEPKFKSAAVPAGDVPLRLTYLN